MGMGICGGAPSSFLVSQRASGGRPRPPRLSSAGASRNLSQRPGRALVRHFDVVPAIRHAQNFRVLQADLHCQKTTLSWTRGGPEVPQGKPVKGFSASAPATATTPVTTRQNKNQSPPVQVTLR